MANVLNRAKRLSGINALAYMGIEPQTAPLLICAQRVPTSDDRVGNQIGALWILLETDFTPARAFLLVRLSGGGVSGGATWMEISGGGSGFVDTFVTDNGIAVPVANTINIIGGASNPNPIINMNTFGSGNTVSIALNNSIFQPDTSADTTEGMYALGNTTFMHNFGTRNTWLGGDAGNLTLTGSTDNVGVGFNAGALLGDDSVFNTIVGSEALSNVTGTSSRNIAIGAGALNSGNSDISQNIAIGNSSLGSAQTGAFDNVAVGHDTLFEFESGSSNTAIGTSSLQELVSSIGNTSVGYASGNSLETGGFNTFVGTSSAFGLSGSSESNIAIGYNALNSSQADVDANICIGNNSMTSATSTVFQNTVVGSEALQGVTQSEECVAVGFRSLQNSTTSTQLVSIGAQSFANFSGTTSVAVGYKAASNMTGGNRDCFLGYNSGIRLLSGCNDNLAAGYGSMGGTAGFVTNAVENVALGSLALASIGDGSSRNVSIGNESAAQISGSCSDNIAIGAGALDSASSNVNGQIAIGTNALRSIGSLGVSNYAIGQESQQANVGGDYNNTLGVNGLNLLVSGDNNNCIGAFSFANLITGFRNLGMGGNSGAGAGGASSDNIALGNSVFFNPADDIVNNIGIGTNALRSLISLAENNVGIGSGALELTGGNYNTALGHLAGSALTTTDSSNIMIRNLGVIGDNNTIRIGTDGSGDGQQDTCFIAGIRGATTGVVDAIPVLIDSAGQLGTVSSSARFKDNISDMGDASSDIMKLRPVTFTYRGDVEQKYQYGLIAEEVEQIMPRLVAYNNDGSLYTVRYNEMTTLLLNEMQKMAKRIEELEKRCTG